MPFSHPWDISPAEAIQLQRQLSQKVRQKPLARTPRVIAGVDVSLERFGTELFAGVIVLSYPELVPLEHAVVKTSIKFPYVPGLLSFREIPGLLACFKKLNRMPDVVVVDGQGIAHPRRLGIAAHLGLLLGIPTIGCAKSRLYGTFVPPGTVGEVSAITDPKTGELLGMALKSKSRSNPLIISPGHLITTEEAVSLIRGCLRGYRLPEPTRLAHILVNKFRKGELKK